MKSYIAIACIFAAFYFTTSCHNSSHPPVTNKDSANCCSDSCTIRNDYCVLDHENGGFEVATADIRIDSFIVEKDGSDHLLLKVYVRSDNDDDAHEAKLIVLLPTDVCDISVLNIDPLIKSYKQCGGGIEFCLGQLATTGIASVRHVTIRTGMAKLPQMKGKESFAGFV
ncbi:MAG: hypothetical protein ABIO81_03695, partial [Ginsengibacter sp.]